MANSNLCANGAPVKRCSKCGQPRHEFRKARNLCRECHKAYHRQYYIKNKAKFNAQSRANHLRTKYGIDDSEVAQMFARQGGVCAICQKPPCAGRYQNFNVDHDHATGRVRGLLCWPCNAGLGHFVDVPEVLERAAAYLRAHREP